MAETKLAGGPTQDEIMAVSLFKLGLRSSDTLLEIGSGTGKVAVAAARTAAQVFSVDRRPEAVLLAGEAARTAGLCNIAFSCTEAAGFLAADRIYDCAFVGGTKQLAEILPVLVTKVRRTIVINAVLLDTLHDAVSILGQLECFREVVQVQVARSHRISGSIMFRPLDPVYIIVGSGGAC